MSSRARRERGPSTRQHARQVSHVLLTYVREAVSSDAIWRVVCSIVCRCTHASRLSGPAQVVHDARVPPRQ